MISELDRDLEFFHKADSELKGTNTSDNFSTKTGISKIYVPNIDNATGPLYLRCDKGNPGDLYDRIEFNLRECTFYVSTNNAVTVDNLCFLYFGSHAIGSSTSNNLTVRNCEIGWGGGNVHNYNPANDTIPGNVTRFGNGVEVYGACRNFRIENCYVYEIYDAGITHQISTGTNTNILMESVYYVNNVLERSIYNIEYFLGLHSGNPTLMKFKKDVYYIGNICRMAGYGWGVQRPDSNLPSNIRAGSGNLASNYVIEDNIFDRTVDFSHRGLDSNVRTLTGFPQSSTPYFVNNKFVQTPGRIMMECAGTYITGVRSEQDFIDKGGKNNTVHLYPDDEQDYIDKVMIYQYP
jgi:hypothetical protein